MNPFYKLSKGIQWLIAIFMFVLLIAIMTYWIEVNDKNKIGYLLLFILIPIGQFLLTPLLTLIGIYKYLSPMLLVFGANQKKYDIHNGTSFDYLLVMNQIKPGDNWRTKMLSYYIQGLLNIVEKIERRQLPENIIIRGSSYFFSERTAKKLGFELEKTGIFERVNLIANVLDLIWMYSLAHGKLIIPNVFKVQTAKITGERLLKQKEKLESLNKFLAIELKPVPNN